MPLYPVPSVKELTQRMTSFVREIDHARSLLNVVDKNTQVQSADRQFLQDYGYTTLQMLEVYNILYNSTREIMDTLRITYTANDFGHWSYPYVWEAGVTGNVDQFAITAGPNGTITAQSIQTEGGTPAPTDVFSELSVGDLILISNAEVAANDGYWDVVSEAAGVLTVTGTLDATGTPDTTMKIELFSKAD